MGIATPMVEATLGALSGSPCLKWGTLQWAARRAWHSREPRGSCLHPRQQGQGEGVGGKISHGHGGKWSGGRCRVVLLKIGGVR